MIEEAVRWFFTGLLGIAFLMATIKIGCWIAVPIIGMFEADDE